MYPRVLSATALLAALSVVGASASDDAAPERVQEKTINAPAAGTDVTPAAETNVTGDNLQTARKPDETPFSEIKILPSF